MQKFGQKLLAVFMCIAMVVSCMTVSASAFTLPALGTVIEWLGGLDAALGIVEKLINFTSGSSNDSTQYLSPSSCLNAEGTRYEVDRSVLVDLAFDWNQNYASEVGFGVDVVDVTVDTGEVFSVIMCRFGGGSGRTGTQRSRMCFADGNTRILYSDSTTETSGRWVALSKAQNVYQLMSYEALYNLATDVSGTVRLSGGYYIITGPLGTNVYCNTAGRKFAAIANKDSAAVNQDRETTTGTIYEGDTITNIENTYNEDNDTTINNDYSQEIDIENMTQVLPGGTLNEIDNLIYDDNTKTYYVDSHDVTNNTTNFYLYQYHINYTSITYIGQTEEYDKYYELYYELPDGRDSADLTVEDLEQLSTTFKDVMNYARSADDLNQRALYHFDGDTADSSYWSYCSSFDWVKGASLTYMDEGTFGGSLYLDETEHDFTLTLPANDAAGDFTLQFRYYQSYTAAPQADSYITIGGVKVLQFTGAQYLNGAGTAIADTSIGSWNELCLMRKDGVLYYYINGVPYGSMAVSIGTSAVRFYFGSTQQTYKKLDELRFTRGAIYTAGENYTPTSVPFDSNLSLVLPDGEIPLADEVMVLSPSSNNLFDSVGLSDWTDESTMGNLKTRLASNKDGGLYASSGVSLYRNTSSAYGSLAYVDGITRYTGKTSTLVTSGNYASQCTGFYLPVCGALEVEDDEDGDYDAPLYSLYAVGHVYTLSVVLSDGSSSACSFEVSGGNNTRDPYICSITATNISSVVAFTVQDLFYKNSNNYGYDKWHRYGIQFYVPDGASIDIIHMELVKGSAPEWSISYEGAVYDPGELTESPVLAVRSNTDITTYQIGGVRPSYPQKGQVYAMVENGYITSLQQYTGSAWESVDGRIWTGSRWIPASSYNVITLQDMYDIVDATEDYEYIYTESGFWDWWQRAWNSFVDKLFNSGNSLGASPGIAAGSITDEVLTPVPDDETTEEDDSWNAFELLVVVKDGTWSIITGVISTSFNGLVSFANSFSNVTGFFNAYDTNSSANVLGITNYGGSDIWD